MGKNIHFFSRNEYPGQDISDRIGIRGTRAVELAQIDTPVLPGIIIDAEIASKLQDVDLSNILRTFSDKVSSETGKKLGDTGKPAIFKIVISPSMEIITHPSIHTIGLTDITIEPFQKIVGENFAYHEYAFYLLKGTINLLLEIEIRKDGKIGPLDEFHREISDSFTTNTLDTESHLDRYKKIVEKARDFLPAEFFADAFFQLEYLIKKTAEFLSLESMDDDDTALIIQPMVYGNYGENSHSGIFYTRNIITGEKKLQGNFLRNIFDSEDVEITDDINEIEDDIKNQLIQIAEKIENYFKEIRQVKFTVEEGKLWLISQKTVMHKSTRAVIQAQLDLMKKKVVSAEDVIKAIHPSEMKGLLLPKINKDSIKQYKVIKGGISGAPGTAVGRLFFSSEALFSAYKKALAEDKERFFILCKPETFPEDVSSIEVASGVITNLGGYSSHSAIIARQYQKAALINPDLTINQEQKQLTFGDTTLKEGDYVSLDIPYYGNPSCILGKAELEEADPEETGLVELLKIADLFTDKIHVMGNADTPGQAALVKKFSGKGIGLCKTEDMVIAANSINLFRLMLMYNDKEKREQMCTKLAGLYEEEFYNIFTITSPYTVNIRLLHASLGNLLPKKESEIADFIDFCKEQDPELQEELIRHKCMSYDEINPILGHRGCRIGISYPEIYRMQIRAIFQAAYKIKKEGKKLQVHIIIPFVLNEQELKFIKNGKKIEGEEIKGIKHIEKEIRTEVDAQEPLDYKVGIMVEVPSAVMLSGRIAKYADFFSIRSSNLTQAVLGLSKDDFSSFLPDYSKYDIIQRNPFRILSSPVKEMIDISISRGRLTRPDLEVGICTDLAFDPSSLDFLLESEANYVSCAATSIPATKLLIARMMIGEN